MSEGSARFALGDAYSVLEQFEPAINMYRAALSSFEICKNTEILSRLYLALGKACSSSKQNDDALEAFEKSLVNMKETKDVFGEGIVYSSSGKLYCSLGQNEEGLKRLRQSLSIFEKIVNDRSEGMPCDAKLDGNLPYELIRLYMDIGAFEHSVGNFDTALEMHRKAKSWREKIGDSKGVGESYLSIGNVFYSMKQFESAADNYRPSLEIHERIGEVKRAGMSSRKLGLVYFHLNQAADSIAMYCKAIERFQMVRDDVSEDQAHRELAQVYSSLNQYDEAKHSLLKSLDINERAAHHEQVGEVCASLFEIYHCLGQGSDKLSMLYKALDAFVRSGNQAAVAEIRHRLRQLDSAFTAPTKSAITENTSHLAQDAHLIPPGVLLKSEKTQKVSPLHEAAFSGDLKRLKELEHRGHLDVNAPSNDSVLDSAPLPHYALHYASLRGHDAVVLYLIELRANLGAVDGRGNSALVWAVRGGVSSTVQLLLQMGANPQEIIHQGETAAAHCKDILINCILKKHLNESKKIKYECLSVSTVSRGKNNGPSSSHNKTDRISQSLVAPNPISIVHRKLASSMLGGILIGSRVRIKGLQASTQYNGKIGIVSKTFQGCKVAVVIDHQKELKLSVEKLELADHIAGDQVKIDGLEVQSQYQNGRIAVIESVEENGSLVLILMDDCKQVIMRAENALPIFEHMSDVQVGLGASWEANFALKRADALRCEAVRLQSPTLYNTAVQAFENALQIVEKTGSNELLALCYQQVGLMHLDFEQNTQALHYISNSLRLRKKCEDLVGEGVSLFCMGEVYYSVEQFKSAVEAYNSALNVFQTAGEQHCHSDIYYWLGRSYSNLAEFDSALEMYRRYLSYQIQLSDSRAVAHAYECLGTTYFQLRRHDEAAEMLSQALEMASNHDSPRDMSRLYFRLGLMKHESGCHLSALDNYAKAQLIAQSCQDEDILTELHLNIGNVHVTCSRYGEALKNYEAALESNSQAQLKDPEGRILLNMGAVYFLQNKPETAISLKLQALQIFQGTGDPMLEGEACLNLSRVYNSIQQYDLSITNAEKALEIFTSMNSRSKQAAAELALAKAYHSNGQHNKALEKYTNTLKFFKDSRQDVNLGMVYSGLSQIYADLGLYDKSSEINSLRQEIFANRTQSTSHQLQQVETVFPNGQTVNDASVIMAADRPLPRVSEWARVSSAPLATMDLLGEVTSQVIVPEGNAKCPYGHVLERRDVYTSYICDVCGRRLLGGERQSCKLAGCNYDVCRDCFKAAVPTASIEKAEASIEKASTEKVAATPDKAGDGSEQSLSGDWSLDKKIHMIMVTALALQRLGKLYDAKHGLEEALKLASAEGDPEKSAKYKSDISFLLSQLLFAMGQYEESLQAAALGLKLAEHDLCAQALYYSHTGECYRAQGKYAEAIDGFNKSKSIHTGLYEAASVMNDKSFHFMNIGISSLNLGSVYHNVGQHAQAIDMHKEALKIGQISGSTDLEGKALGNLGTVYFACEQYERAKDMHSKSLEIKKRTKDIRGQGKTLQSLGIVHVKLKEYDEALVFLRQSLDIRKEANDVQGEGRLYISLGLVNSGQGQQQLAAEMYGRSLEIADRIGDPFLERQAAQNLGELMWGVKDYLKAAEHFEVSIMVCEKLQELLLDRDKERVTIFEEQRISYIRLQQCFLELGREADALVVSERSKARALQRLMSEQSSSPKEMPEDKVTPEDVLLMAQQEDSMLLEFSLLTDGVLASWLVSTEGNLLASRRVNLSNLMVDFLLQNILGNHLEGLSHMKQEEVVKIWREEGNHFNMTTLMIFLDITRCALGTLDGRTLMKDACSMSPASRKAAEEAALIQIRARQSLARSKKALQRLTARCPKGHELQYHKSRERYECSQCGAGVEICEERLCCLRGVCNYSVCPKCIASSSPAVCEVHQGDDDDLVEEVESLLREHKCICKWLKTLTYYTPESGVDLDSFLDALDAMRHSVTTWQELLSVTDDFLASKCCISNFSVRRILLDKIKDLFDTDKLLKQLYTLLINPIHDLLPPDADLLIVPDMDLFMVPWAALKDDKGDHLIQKASIRLAPSLKVARQASTDVGTLRRRPPKVCIAGNPWPLGRAGFKRLLHAGEEAVAVGAHLASALTTEQCECLIEGAATKARVLELLHGSDLVHLACHGWLERQSLVLACDNDGGLDDGLLLARDIQDKVRFAAGCSVVLSACNSGRGEVRGEGVVGLSRAFFAAGASAVVVSLWSIPDDGTRALMDAFYFALKRGHTMPRALRAAMLAMLRAGRGPLSWAGFVVAGAATRLPRDVELFGVEELASLFRACGLDADRVAAD